MAVRKPPKSPRRAGRGKAGDRSSARADIWLYGLHAAGAVIANPRRELKRLVIAEGAGAAAKTVADAATLGARRPPLERLNRAALARLLPRGAIHQGLAVLARALAPPDWDAIAEGCGDEAVVVVLDRVTDPRNVGAILRSAAAFGAAAVILPGRHAPPESGALAKAAAGALESVPVIRAANLARALDRLAEAGFWRLGLDAEAKPSLAEARADGRIALVLGGEGSGLRRLTRAHCDALVRVPVAAAVESLNVSNAAAVALYELRRADHER